MAWVGLGRAFFVMGNSRDFVPGIEVFVSEKSQNWGNLDLALLRNAVVRLDRSTLRRRDTRDIVLRMVLLVLGELGRDLVLAFLNHGTLSYLDFAIVGEAEDLIVVV